MVSFIIISDTIEKTGSHKEIREEVDVFLNQSMLTNKVVFNEKEDGFSYEIKIHLQKDSFSQEVFGRMLSFVRNTERTICFSFRFVSKDEVQKIDTENFIFISLDTPGWKTHLRNSFRDELNSMVRGYASEALVCHSIAEVKKETAGVLSYSFRKEEEIKTISIKDIVYSSDKQDREQGVDIQCIYIGNNRHATFRFGVKSSEDGIRLRTTFKNIPQIAVYPKSNPQTIYRALCKMIFYYEQGTVVSMVVSQKSIKEILES